jgi:hypothetical protein
MMALGCRVYAHHLSCSGLYGLQDCEIHIAPCHPCSCKIRLIQNMHFLRVTTTLLLNLNKCILQCMYREALSPCSELWRICECLDAAVWHCSIFLLICLNECIILLVTCILLLLVGMLRSSLETGTLTSELTAQFQQPPNYNFERSHLLMYYMLWARFNY